MGWQARINQHPDVQAQRTMRRILMLFPDRATYEQWLTARNVSEAHRAHMEQFLPEHLKVQGSV